jgi:hypothetical protein
LAAQLRRASGPRAKLAASGRADARFVNEPAFSHLSKIRYPLELAGKIENLSPLRLVKQGT